MSVIPGTDTSYTSNVNITIAEETLTFTGLSQGAIFFRLQLYVDGQLILTSNDIDVIID